MSDGTPGAGAEDPFRVAAEAQSFRARGEPVYPGKLLVLRGGSSAVHPVDDDAHDPSTEHIMGIAIWGAQPEWQPGMARVEDGPDGKSAPFISGEMNRPTTGVGRIDAWIARADTLRKLRRGVVVSFGPIPLTQTQLIASVGEIEKIVRESAIRLLRSAPQDQRPTLLALASVADTQNPQDAELTEAIRELLVAAPSWSAKRAPIASPEPVAASEATAAGAAPHSADRERVQEGDTPIKKKGTNVGSGIGGTYTNWKDVQGRLLVKRERGEPFTGFRRLAKELQCSDATVRKAIKGSPTLQGWRARHTGAKAAPKTTDLGALVRDSTRQTTEPAPDDVLPADDVDATMARLIDQARPDERAKLNALDNAGRRALVATVQAQNLDDEPSPLESDKPGERTRKVKQHKRV